MSDGSAGAANTTTRSPVRTVVDVDEVFQCPYCRHPFSSRRLVSLHLGDAHAERLDAEEWESVELAREAESAELRRLRLKLTLLLVSVYFGFVVLYALVSAGIT